MAYIPPNPNGQSTMANSTPVAIASDNVVAVSQGASSFTASTNNSSTAQLAAAANFTGTIESVANYQAAQVKVVSDQAVTVNLYQYVDSGGTRLASTDTFTRAAGNPLNENIALVARYFGIKVTNTGGSTTTTLNINTTFGTMPSGARANSNLGNQKMSLSDVNGTAISLGQAAAAASIPVVLANEQTTSDTYITGQSAQTALVNNIIPATSSSSSTDATGYKSASIQVVSTGTGGGFIFEGSNDNVNFQAIPVYNQLILTGTPIVAAITASASQNVYIFPIETRYIRLRISTAVTGGSVQAFTRLSTTTYAPTVTQVAQSTATNLNTNVASGTITTVGGVTTLSTMTNGNLGFPGTIADVVSAALATTTTSSTFTPTYGTSYQINVPVTVVSGTTPTLDIEIQESRDAGTNWVPIYDFPRITATGSYNSPVLTLTGNRIRYVQTVAGSTPSFTRAINRLQESNPGSIVRQIIDRTITLTSLASTTAVLYAEQSTKNVMMTINIGAATGAPSIQIQASDDAGASWYSIGTALAAVASTTVSATVTNVTAQQYRCIVTSAGSGVTAGYVLLRSF